MNDNYKNMYALEQDEPDMEGAWKDMIMRLDANMPVRKQRAAIINFEKVFKYAAVVLLFISISFVLNSPYLRPRQGSLSLNQPSQPVDQPIEPAVDESNEEMVVKKNKVNEPDNDAIEQQDKMGISTVYTTPDNTDTSINDISEYEESDMPSKTSYSFHSTDNLTKDIQTEKSLAGHLIPDPLIDPAPINSIKKEKRKLSFDIGAYHNIGSTSSGIYPVLNMNIPVGKKGSISAGIAMSSKVPVQDFAPKEFVILNDSVNRVHFTVARRDIRKVTYIDVPLAYNYAVDKHLSLSAGLQFSFLQHFNKDYRTKAFGFAADFQKEVSDKIPDPAALQPMHVYAERFEVKNVNMRFVAGASYKIKDFGVRVQYQPSFTANFDLFDFTGANTKKRVSVYTVGMFYQLN